MFNGEIDKLFDKIGSLPLGDRQAEGQGRDLDEQLSEEMEEIEEVLELPLLPVRDTVIFPNMVSPLFVGRDRSVKALEAAVASGGSIIVVAQKEAEVDHPGPDDLYSVGTVVSIELVWRLPDGTTSG